MIITPIINPQDTTASKKTNTKEEIIDPFKGQNYLLNTLDEEGNELLNEALAGKTDDEKWILKLSLDMSLSTEVKNQTLANKTDIDNSRDGSIDSLEAFINERKRLFTPDMLGTVAIATQLLKAYTDSSIPFDIEYQEDDVVDNFFNDLYSKESISFSSSKIKDDINKQVEEKAMELFSTKADSPESILDINHELQKYKQSLLKDYKLSLEDTNSPNLEKEAVIKVLLEETDKKTSAFEELLTKKVNTNKEVVIHESIDEHKLETLDDAGNEVLNTLLIGMDDEEKIIVKLMLDFRLMIKDVKFENGELHLTYEKNNNPEAIKEKLDRLIYEKEKSPDSFNLIGKQEWLRILNGLRDSYDNIES